MPHLLLFLKVSRVSEEEEEEEEVEGHTVAVCQYSLVPTRPSVHMELAGVASYQLPDGEPQTTRFSYTLSLTNFIRCSIHALIYLFIC